MVKVFIEEKSPWHFNSESMYRKDRYARDRVMKSARLLLPHLKDNDTVLDVGCFTQEAAKYYPKWVHYIGIDQKQYHTNTRILDLNQGFEPIPCQGALCLETLEHLLHPSDTLKSISECLSPGGYLVVSLPNEATIFHRVRCLLGIVDNDCFSGQGKHLHLPSLKQARNFLRQEFEIVDEKYYISPNGVGSTAPLWFLKLLSLIPDQVHETLARIRPSLFARGFIFLLRKSSSQGSTEKQA